MEKYDMTEKKKNITVAIPLNLLKVIEETARTERRSVSAEIVFRLEKTVKPA